MKTDREIVEFLVRHFVVKNGPNVMQSQYGHLQIWWAAFDIMSEPNALKNPHMMLGSATNSYAVAAMAELKALIDAARVICEKRISTKGVEDAQASGEGNAGPYER